MTPDQKKTFETMLTAIEREAWEDRTTRVVVVLCRILLELGPAPLPTIQRDEE